jgi:hypothetical protein
MVYLQIHQHSTCPTCQAHRCGACSSFLQAVNPIRQRQRPSDANGRVPAKRDPNGYIQGELVFIFLSDTSGRLTLLRAPLTHTVGQHELREPEPDTSPRIERAITMSTAAEVETVGGSGGNADAPVVMVVERVVTVEYLESSMSRGLLGKFPDSSAFDFDYSQSGIWSPLNKHPRAMSCSGGGDAAEASSSTDFLIANPKRKARASGCRIKGSVGCGGGGKSRWRRRRLRRDGSFLDLHEAGRTKLDFSPPSPPPAKVVATCI